MYFYKKIQMKTCISIHMAEFLENSNGEKYLYHFKTEVTIGDVRKKITLPKTPQYIPHKYLKLDELSEETLTHLKWMLQKDILKQDIFLIGRPGPARRQLAMTFLELTGREVEYVSLSRDTTEADLKQRREILRGSALYFDQNAVRAATEGRVLILEGIEKAERNVLPVLNNLLENREMHLEDGRFLIPASRYDKLLQEHSKEELDKWNLVRVSDEFRVIALGLPVPKYSGNPLDPPLRSRFQARNISQLSFTEQLSILKQIAPNVDPTKLTQLLSCGYALLSEESASLGLPDFPMDNIQRIAHVLKEYPDLEPVQIFNCLYPYKSFLSKEGRDAVEHVFKSFKVKLVTPGSGKVDEVRHSSGENLAICSVALNRNKIQVKVPCGSLEAQKNFSKYIPTGFQDNLITELILSHSISDFCLIGPKGCGKSATVFQFASLLNYEIEPIVLYQDITSRDLIQQRTTLPNGDTVWHNSPLIQAALDGKLAILDGIDRVHPSTLSVIHSLVQDRDVQLYDGKRLVRYDRYEDIKQKYNLTDSQMSESGILKVHPAFRIVALAESSKKGVNTTKWLSAEMLSLFLFHEMRPLSYQEESYIIEKSNGSLSEDMKKILNLAATLRSGEDGTLSSLSSFFSTRQLLRMSKRLSTYPDDSVYDAVQKACLSRFLPTLTRDALIKALKDVGIEPDNISENKNITCQIDDQTVTIGNTKVERYITQSKSKVPDILFYDVPQHLMLLEYLIQDFMLGEHLLLVGNQGVGKNKIADRLLQLLNRPRDYIQLHRDTTVQTLTIQPTIKDGVVSYEDSPLVQAVKFGNVLVVDEADKAPTHVTCILKTLVERGEMSLSDGRKIIPHGDVRANQPQMIEMHPDFRMIVLANRPGFPFLGNDFFGALGDLFSCHAVDNPSPSSEIALLKQYGPNVPESIILKLVNSFGELRSMSDKGLVQYPYSTREVVNIVKHLQSFPGESLSAVINNVFDFDKYSSNALETVIPVLQKHGIPIDVDSRNISLAKEYSLPKISKLGSWNVRRISVDDKNLVEIKNIKMGEKRNLVTFDSALDLVQVRGTFFSEMYSHSTIPLSENGVCLNISVSKRTSASPEQICVVAVNPLRLYITVGKSDKLKVIDLRTFQVKLFGNQKFKPNLVHINYNMSDHVLIHEENTNQLLLVNTEESTGQVIDLTSTLDKLVGVLNSRNATSYNWKMNTQLSDQNVVILYSFREGLIQVLDFNNMVSYSMDIPVSIKTLQVVDIGKWMLQSSDNSKYLLLKQNPGDPVPSQLHHIAESLKSDQNLGVIQESTVDNLSDDVLSNLLNQNIKSPNRLFVTDQCYAVVTVGFPELEDTDVYCYFRPNLTESWTGLRGKSVFLKKSSQIVTPVNRMLAPKELQEKNVNLVGFLEVLDLNRRSLQYIPVPHGSKFNWYVDPNVIGLYLKSLEDEELVTVDTNGNIRFWQTNYLQLERSLDDWKKMIGMKEKPLQLTIEKSSGREVSKPKHGKVDPENKPHVGGNTWAGGTGGRDTAGLGGKGGPYRLDAGHNVHQLSDEEKASVPESVRRAAREMGKKAFQQRLQEIKMSEYDHEMYDKYYSAVSHQIYLLKIIIENLQAKAKERDWVRHQTTGNLDDLKLIEGITGEKTIYRRRAEKEPDPGAPLMKPKRLKLVVDVSGSMYRFNGYDGRLDRMLEASVLVMESFADLESKFKYDIIGHSGEDFNITFVDVNNPPKTNKDRLNVIKNMNAHSQFCMSGDHTLPATKHAIESISKEDCDEAIVIVLSDANFQRYGIKPSSFGRVLTSNPDVGAYAILIGSLGDEAIRLAGTLPAGRAFVCMDLKNIPQILQQIFTSSVLSTT